MDHIRIKQYQWLTLLILLFTMPLQASDRLQQSSLFSEWAQEALLLDITEAGTGLIAVGDQATLLKSTDGTNWLQQTLPFSVLLTAVSFVNADQGWVVGHDGLLAMTRDGGVSWQQQLDGNQINQLRLERLRVLAGELLLRSDAEPDNELLLEQIDTLSWQIEDAEIAVEEGPSVPLLDIWFGSEHEGYALGAYGLLLKTRDGGDSWQYWGDRLDNPDNFHLNAILKDHRDDLYIAGEAGSLFRSRDSGESWETLYSPYDGSFFGITEFKQNLYLMGLRGHLFRSQDGDVWQELSSGTQAALAGSAANDEELMLFGSGGVVLSSHDGERFSVLDSGSRSGISAGLFKDNKRILVGENGILVLEGTP